MKSRLEHYRTKLTYLSPVQQLREKRQYLADTQEQLEAAMNGKLEQSRHRLQIYLERFRGLSPLEKLNQGFSYVENSQGRAVTRISQVKEGDLLAVQVTDGKIRVRVLDKETIERRQRDG